MFAALIVLSTMVASADPPKEKEKEKAKELSAEAKKELKKLEGKWQLVKVRSSEGEAELKDLNLEAFLVIEGTKLTMSARNKSETAEITDLDPSTDPKCIDLTEIRPGRPDQFTEAIYKIDGDTLQIAMSPVKEGNKFRPTSFDKPTERRVVVWILKRVKE